MVDETDGTANLNEDLHVMIIDDQATMRKIVRGLLAQVGIKKISEANDGGVALEMLMKHGCERPDVIICDLYMENMDGMEFCNKLRRHESSDGPATPILVLTGEQDELVHEVARQVGAVTVLTKPIDSAHLAAAIGRAVGFELA